VIENSEEEEIEGEYDDPVIFLSPKVAVIVARILEHADDIAKVVDELKKYVGPFADVLAELIALTGGDLGDEIATGLDNCVGQINDASTLKQYDRCKIYVEFFKTKHGIPYPVYWGIETCWGDKKYPEHYCDPVSVTEEEA
jgi:hypothetical protein